MCLLRSEINGCVCVHTRYQNWKEGQHYDGKDEQCGIMYQRYDWGKWDDDNCYKPLGYICKRREYKRGGILLILLSHSNILRHQSDECTGWGYTLHELNEVGIQ